jgi:pSer/pThr/pTyr-binding forkhead associated (FHA) protein
MQRTDIRIEARFADPSADGGGTAARDPAGSGSVVPAIPTRDPTATRVYTIPQPSAPRASVQVTDPNGRIRRFSVAGPGLTIGRSEDNDVVANDPRVSRHHGRITGRRGTLVYLDLGSSNGSRVNGEPVSEVVLGVGDRLEVGGTTIEVEAAADG